MPELKQNSMHGGHWRKSYTLKSFVGYQKVRHRVDGWKQLMVDLEAEVVAEAQKEGLPAPREPNSGLMKQLEPFMKKYGYANGAGWWIKKKETEREEDHEF